MKRRNEMRQNRMRGDGKRRRQDEMKVEQGEIRGRRSEEENRGVMK